MKTIVVTLTESIKLNIIPKKRKLHTKRSILPYALILSGSTVAQDKSFAFVQVFSNI